jgi:hypothetical protein
VLQFGSRQVAQASIASWEEARLQLMVRYKAFGRGVGLIVRKMRYLLGAKSILAKYRRHMEKAVQ